MFTFIGMINLTMVVNSTNNLTEISGLRFCDVDRFNAKGVKLIEDKSHLG